MWNIFQTFSCENAKSWQLRKYFEGGNNIVQLQQWLEEQYDLGPIVCFSNDHYGDGDGSVMMIKKYLLAVKLLYSLLTSKYYFWFYDQCRLRGALWNWLMCRQRLISKCNNRALLAEKQRRDRRTHLIVPLFMNRCPLKRALPTQNNMKGCSCFYTDPHINDWSDWDHIFFLQKCEHWKLAACANSSTHWVLSHGELQRSVWFPAWANTQSGRWEWRKAKRGGFEDLIRARVSHCLRTAWEVHSG